MVDSWQDSVVLITSKAVDNNVYGTGFVVHQDEQGAYVLTCTHVVDDVGGKELVKVNDIPATVIASDQADGIDIAVLRVVGLADKPMLHPHANCKRGLAFECAGYYHLDDNPKKKLVLRRLYGVLNDLIKAGMALNTLVSLWEMEITSDDELRPGNSGSPVVDENNYVIGIVNTRLNSNKKRGWITPIEALEKIWPAMSPGLFARDTVSRIVAEVTPQIVDNLRLIYTLTGHTKSVYCVAISADGQILASGSDDKTIKVWDLSTGMEAHTLSGHTGHIQSLAISADGQTLASGSWDNTVKVWDLSIGKEIRTLTGHTGNFLFSGVSVAVSTDGQTLVSGGSTDKTIKVWDLTNGKVMRTLISHRK